MTDWLIDTATLAARLKDAAAPCVVLDCSWYLPETGRRGRTAFEAGHIPGARFIDLAEISDPRSPYVNMLPTAADFAAKIGALGIDNETEVVLYDGGYVSCRLWWMFRSFGHERLRILDGGWRKWTAEGRPVETGPAPAVAPRTFTAHLATDRLATIDDVRLAVADGSPALVDARTAARFDGHEGSGYPGVASGFMPGAVNTPWALFFDADRQHSFVRPERAAEIFAEAGVDIAAPVIATCGSGVTACILGFMIEALGGTQWRIYDGSWHEWGQQPDTPKGVKPLPPA